MIREITFVMPVVSSSSSRDHLSCFFHPLSVLDGWENSLIIRHLPFFPSWGGSYYFFGCRRKRYLIKDSPLFRSLLQASWDSSSRGDEKKRHQEEETSCS